MTTQTPLLNFLLGSSASLHCGFSVAPGLDLTGVEWRLQHKGHGQLVYSWTTGQRQAKREGASLESEQLLLTGDASLTLPSLTLKDEGTYICQITTSLYQAQQIVQLHVQGEVIFGSPRRGEGICLWRCFPGQHPTQGQFSEKQAEWPQPNCHLHPRSADCSLSDSRVIPVRNFPAQEPAALPWLAVSKYLRPLEHILRSSGKPWRGCLTGRSISSLTSFKIASL